MYNNIPIRVCTYATSYCWHWVVRLHHLTYQDQTLHRVITLVCLEFTDIWRKFRFFFFFIEKRRLLDEGKILFLRIKLTIKNIVINSDLSDIHIGLKLCFFICVVWRNFCFSRAVKMVQFSTLWEVSGFFLLKAGNSLVVEATGSLFRNFFYI